LRNRIAHGPENCQLFILRSFGLGWVRKTQVDTFPLAEPDWAILGRIVTDGDHYIKVHVAEVVSGFGFAAVCDALDGTLARVSGKGSRFGAFLDSTIDRTEESIVFLGLSIHYARVGGELEIPLILVVAIGSLMVSYTRARAEGVGVACKVGFMTRVPRVAIMIVGMILNQVLIALIILAVTTWFTTFHRMYQVWRMTGGEAGGWGPPKEPYSPPVVEKLPETPEQ